MPHPNTQRELADLVDNSLKHEIRAGYTHRFITLMFVTVGERVFCRRYTYGEPSWHSVFQTDPAGQVKLDKTIVNIEARVPRDLDEIVPDVDQAYADALKKLGASYMLAGATEPRARLSTMEIRLAEPAAGVPQCLPEPRYLKSSASPPGLEPGAYCLGGSRSIHLSYGDRSTGVETV